jgi:hypothetical protein
VTHNGEGRPWEPPQPTDPLDLAVLAILRDGRTHRREDVSRAVQANLRDVRGAVSALRILGWPICFGDEGGYRLSWDDDALDQLERKYHRQALSELRTLNRIRRMRRNHAAPRLVPLPTRDELLREKIEADLLQEDPP